MQIHYIPLVTMVAKTLAITIGMILLTVTSEKICPTWQLITDYVIENNDFKFKSILIVLDSETMGEPWVAYVKYIDIRHTVIVSKY